MSTTAGQVVTAVLQRLEEQTSSPVFVARSEILQLINDAFLEFQLIACQQTSERTYTLIGSKLQAVPIGAIAVLHVAYASKKIEKTSIENLDRGNPRWDALTGILQQWAPMGLDSWIADRHPSAAANVTLTTLNQPTVWTEDDTIDLEQEYIDGLVEYGFHMARFKEGGPEFQQSMDNYDRFLNISGLHMKQTFAEQFVAISRDPNADTGLNYSTLSSN